MKTKEECYREALEESPYGILTYETALNAMDKYAEEFYKSKLAEKLPSDQEIKYRASLHAGVPCDDPEMHGSHYKEIYDECIRMGQWVKEYVINKLTE